MSYMEAAPPSFPDRRRRREEVVNDNISLLYSRSTDEKGSLVSQAGSRSLCVRSDRIEAFRRGFSLYSYSFILFNKPAESLFINQVHAVAKFLCEEDSFQKR